MPEQAESPQLRPLAILLVEDNVADVHWLRLVLDDGLLPYAMVVADNGEEAIDYLQTGARPDLILLDINLPRVSGIEVLEAIRTSGDAADIPLCVVTGSELERDLVIRKYSLKARCYIVKPLTAEALGDALRTYEILQPWSEEWDRMHSLTDRRAGSAPSRQPFSGG